VELDRAVVEAIAPLEPGYGSLLARLASALTRDERVRALWLAGSVSRGVADAGSDLDVVVTVTSVQDFVDPATWSLLDPVITTPIPGMPGCFAFTTRQGLRVDVVLETPADLASTAYRSRIRVFDHDDLVPPAPTRAEPGPDPARMQAIVEEILRQAAIFPAAVVAREDWLLGQQAVHNYGLMLYQLFVESNAPLPPMGVKQWSSRLTGEQRQILSDLTPPRARRDDVIVAMRAMRTAISTHGRAVVEASGGVWPIDVDEAMQEYWRRHGLA
jgi:predicted nucleotidyltransferase